MTDKIIGASYSIHLHSRDEALLLRIKQFFDNKGNVYLHEKTNSASYRMKNISDINILIIHHFNKFLLSGNKEIHFKIWKQIVELLINKAHLTEQGKEKLRELKSTLNKYS